jgi:hypothetical protein
LEFKAVILFFFFSVSFVSCNSEEQNFTPSQVELTATRGVNTWILAVNLFYSMASTNIPVRDSFGDRLCRKKKDKEN